MSSLSTESVGPLCISAPAKFLCLCLFNEWMLISLPISIPNKPILNLASTYTKDSSYTLESNHLFCPNWPDHNIIKSSLSVLVRTLDFVSKNSAQRELACIIWKFKNSTNLRPGYWSKDSNTILHNLVSLFPSFGSAFHLLISSKLTLDSLSNPRSKACLFLNNFNKKFRTNGHVCWLEMCPSLNNHCGQKDGPHWLVRPASVMCAPLCWGGASIKLKGVIS